MGNAASEGPCDPQACGPLLPAALLLWCVAALACELVTLRISGSNVLLAGQCLLRVLLCLPSFGGSQATMDV